MAAPFQPLPSRVLVVGVSTRAAAESAAREGFLVTALDAFGDLDQHRSVRALSLQRDYGLPFSALAAARAAAGIDCDAVVYLSSFENHRQAVRTLASGRALWGNSPAVLRRVRQPTLVLRALRRRGFATPAIAAGCPTPRGTKSGTAGAALPLTTGNGRWLVKPLASGGGHRVRTWRRGTGVPRGSYLQEFVDGVPGSVVFVAAGGRMVPLGVSRQLVGEHAFGAAGYRYCGSILARADDPQFARGEVLVTTAQALARAVAEDFDLVGVNGVDFVARDGVPYAIEVNPRWSASMELVERSYGYSVFAGHAAACVSGVLPAFDLSQVRRRAEAIGKAVVFARDAVVLGDTAAWLEDPSVRDVPHPGETILAGRPVCTVLASGCDAAACHASLVQRAERVYAQLAHWKQRIA